jgi:ADP-ribose pyrophosphatase YjhB (NUDIX family)
MSEKQNYVVGFLLDPTLSKVVLIRKNKPAFQCDLLNGVGGKIEPGEASKDAMDREFFEEAGIKGLDWRHFLTLHTPSESLLYFFFAIGNVHKVKSITPEEVKVYDINEIMNRCDTMPNIRWCIQMARSIMFGEHARFFDVCEEM